MTYCSRASISLVVCAALTACHTWEASPSAIEQQSLPNGSNVRVHTREGARIEMVGARLEPDSLIGRVASDRVAIALADIRSLDTARFSRARTARVIVSGILAVPTGYFLFLLTSSISHGFN